MMLFFVILLGFFVGSFLNVLSDRLPRDESINGRSYCESCKHILSVRDLIPVLSYLALDGKCRYCKASFSWVYPFAEIFTAVLFGLSWYLYQQLHIIPASPQWIQELAPRIGTTPHDILGLIYIAIVACFIVILLSDFKYQIIPDEIQIALVVLAVLKMVVESSTLEFAEIIGAHFFAGFLVMIPILLIFLITRGRGMGFGDVKFAFVMGLLLGWLSGFIAMYIGFVSGAIFGITLIFMGKGQMKTKVAFGPFLVFGTYIMMFYGEEIVEYVRVLYGI